MRIDLTPQRRDVPVSLARYGDVLVIDGVDFDFGPLADGDVLPDETIDSPWFAGPVTRIDGRLHLTLVLPHGPNAPPETRFPASLDLTADGPVELPPFDAPSQEGAADADNAS
jgi:hypothetical protein